MMVSSAIASNIKRYSVDVPNYPPVPPRDYYISASGSGDGLTSGAPAPLSTLLAATLNPSDHIYLNKGDTFIVPEFQILVNNVTIESYGTGAEPIILGSNSLTAATWTDEGSGQYSTPLASVPDWVYIDLVSAHLGESAWIPVQTNNSSQVRTLTSGIDGLGSLVGSSVVFKEYNFRLSEELVVSAQSGRQITFIGTLVGADQGMPAKFFHQRQFLTTNGDWCYTGGKLYIKAAATPAGTDIRICTNDYGFFINNSSGVTISGLDIRHYSKYAVYIYSAASATITNCIFKDIRGNAFRINGFNNSNLTIEDNTFERCALRGIEYAGIETGSISYNTFSNIGTDSNLGHPYDQNKTGGSALVPLVINPSGSITVSNNVTFEHNVIHDVGYQCAYIWGNNNIFQDNHLYNYCQKWNDGGAVHMFYGNYLGLNSSTTGNIIRRNVIHDGVGNVDGVTGIHATIVCNGIYFDNGITGNTIDNNFIYNPGTWGILLNTFTTAHTVTNNKVMGATTAQIEFRQDANGLAPYFSYSLMQNCVFTGNIMVCNTTTARSLIITSNNTSTPFNPFTSINNNHYVNPYGTNLTRRSQSSTSSGNVITDYTLAAWKTYIASDAASTSYENYKVTPVAGDVSVFTNVTGSNTNESIPALHTDVYGNAPSNPYTIVPFSGLIYLKQ